ncbi:MAG: chemotaxis protein CheW [Armatimonadetes bacterium]|nr:chemotaxis protein CheW [Armatimonadota bacterium]
MTVATSHSHLYLGCRLGAQEYVLPLDSVKGVTSLARANPLPDAPPGVLGVTTVGGRALLVLDLAACLDLPCPPASSHSPVIVAAATTGPGAVWFGLRVDRTGEVVGLHQSELDRASEEGHRSTGVAAVAAVGRRMLRILDLPALADWYRSATATRSL